MEQSPIPEIIDAIAEVEGIEPSELDSALYEYIEPEAIQQLASHGTVRHNLAVVADDSVRIHLCGDHWLSKAPCPLADFVGAHSGGSLGSLNRGTVGALSAG